MVERVNGKSNHLSMAVGDYVYRLWESSKIGQKLHNKYDGPFVIDYIESPHLVVLVDPVSGKRLDRSVHLDRFKFAYVRQLNPLSYLPDTVVAKASTAGKRQPTQGDGFGGDCTDTDRGSGQIAGDSSNEDSATRSVRKSTRKRKVPERYGLGIDPDSLF